MKRDIILKSGQIILLLLLLACSDDIKQIKSAYLHIDSSRTIASVLEEYPYFDQTTWNDGLNWQGEDVISFIGELNNAYMKECLNSYFQSQINRQPKNYITRRKGIILSKTELLHDLKSLFLYIDFKEEKNGVQVKNVYCWAELIIDGKSHRFFSGDQDKSIVRNIYKKGKFSLKFSHLHKYYYH